MWVVDYRQPRVADRRKPGQPTGRRTLFIFLSILDRFKLVWVWYSHWCYADESGRQSATQICQLPAYGQSTNLSPPAENQSNCSRSFRTRFGLGLEYYTTILYYTILLYTIIYYTILLYYILYYTILYYTILFYSIFFNTILYYTILYY